MSKNLKVNLKSQPMKGKGAKEGSVLLTMQGELIIDNAATVKKFLVDSIDKYSSFKVAVSNVDNIDLSFIQLLQRFIWDLGDKGKTVDLDIKLTDEFTALLQRAGFQSFISQGKQVPTNTLK